MASRYTYDDDGSTWGHRDAGYISLGAFGHVSVRHLYPISGDEVSPGVVEIAMHSHPHGENTTEDDECVEALHGLGPEEALALAHFLTRAADWVYDVAIDDPPDVEREAARLKTA